VRIVWCLTVLCACSSNPGGTTHPTKPPPPGVADAAVGSGAAEPVHASADECERLAAHAVELAAREHAPPADPPLTETESREAAAGTRALVTECTTMPREAVRCALAAPSLAALTACH
jgi:hypothetical protein